MTYSASEIENRMRIPEFKEFVLNFLVDSVDFQAQVAPTLKQLSIDSLSNQVMVLQDRLSAAQNALAAAQNQPLPP